MKRFIVALLVLLCVFSALSAKSIVVYFSCTGYTRSLAQKIASFSGSDTFEIQPVQAYTSADLNYRVTDCRANLEMNDPASRPAISNALPSLTAYDTIFLGFPIWWGDMPRIISTFLDAVDLSGKKVYPFCTSGGSGISTAVSSIRKMEPKADVKSGLQVGSSAVSRSDDKIRKFIASK